MVMGRGAGQQGLNYRIVVPMVRACVVLCDSSETECACVVCDLSETVSVWINCRNSVCAFGYCYCEPFYYGTYAPINDDGRVSFVCGTVMMGTGGVSYARYQK
jgi:hypothetical protein